MKTILNIVIIMAAALVARGQASFEGVLEFSTFTKANLEEAQVKWFTKEGNNRLEIKSSGKEGSYNMTLLFRKGDPLIYMFGGEGESKTLYTLPNESIEDATMLSGAKVSRGEGKRTIAGYNCTLVKVETASGSMECWVSEEMNLNVDNLPSVLRSKGAIGALRGAGMNGLPLAVVNRDMSGETVFSFTVSKVTAKNLEASLFSVPTGYSDGQEEIKKSIKAE